MQSQASPGGRGGGHFDLQGHRGAWGLVPCNTVDAFAAALEVGVSTLELDVGVSRDGQVVVSHDRHVSARLYRDTAPVHPEDRLFPYVGQNITNLTLAQLRSLAAIPQSRRFGKFLSVSPARTRYGQAGFLPFLRCSTFAVDPRSMPGLRLGALVTESGFLTGVADHWTGGIDVRARPFRGDHAAAAASLGATALCVNWQACTEAVIRSAHQAELLLLAWTVNSKATMRRLIDRGVDGIVTDFPDRLREVMTEKGMPLPCPAPVKPCKAPAA